MAAVALRRAAKAPIDYGPELVTQLRFTLGICFFPMILTAFALSFGPAGIQASNFFELFGADLGPYAAIVAIMSFVMTGHRSVYPSQILRLRKSDSLDIDLDEAVRNVKQAEYHRK